MLLLRSARLVKDSVLGRRVNLSLAVYLRHLLHVAGIFTLTELSRILPLEIPSRAPPTPARRGHLLANRVELPELIHGVGTGRHILGTLAACWALSPAPKHVIMGNLAAFWALSPAS